MRLVPALVLAAGVVLAAGNPTPADDKKPADKEKKMQLPDLKAKEWKKQPNGLEIWDVKEGKGDPVKAGGKVKVHYTGWLLDGKVFDSSVSRGEPIEFGLNQVIKGWQEGIPGMKPGGVRRLKIPPELAYGKRGAGRDIPPDSTLVFEVELLEAK
jgi:FKBP-type peptidyl-prolyl cis-trans isomerase